MAAPVSIIEKLSAEDRERILGWLEIHPIRKVVEMVAQDPPDGFGLKTHETTLRRFAARHRIHDRSEELDIARLLAKAGADNPMDSATESLLSDWAFEIASSPRRKVSAFKLLSRWVLKLRDFEHKNQALALRREEFQFNAARQAMIHWAAIARVAREPDMDEEDKILAVRQAIFGCAPGSPDQKITNPAAAPEPAQELPPAEPDTQTLSPLNL